MPERTKGWGADKVVVEPAQLVTIDVEINWQALGEWMAQRAAKSKRGRSTALARMIKAKVVKKVAA